MPNFRDLNGHDDLLLFVHYHLLIIL